MRLGHLFGQILPIVQNASAASAVTGGFCLFPSSRSPGVKNWTPGIPGSSREFPLPGIPIFAPWPTITAITDLQTLTTGHTTDINLLEARETREILKTITYPVDVSPEVFGA